MPPALLQNCSALINRTHQTVGRRALVGRVANKRNTVALAILPGRLTLLRATASAFKIRVLLWLLAAVALVLCLVWSWWLAILSGIALVVAEGVVAVKERHLWTGLAAMLLSADVLVSNFAGWPEIVSAFGPGAGQ
jgi:hypothetical protein